MNLRHLRWLSLATLAAVCLATPTLPQSPLGPEFRVNTTTSGPQRIGGLAMSVNGEFLVSWGDDFSLSSGQPEISGIRGQFFNTDGSASGSEFVVAASSSGYFLGADVLAARPDGGFVVVWGDQSPASNGQVRGIVLSAEGSPSVPEFPVTSRTTPDLFNPFPRAVATSADGRFVVVWKSEDQDGSREGAFARRFRPRGTPLGSEFQINRRTLGDQVPTDVIVQPDGSFVVGWYSEDDPNSPRQGPADVYLNRYDSDGRPLLEEFRVNTYTTGRQLNPALSMDQAGNFVVVWDSLRQDGSDYGVFGQRFSASGERQGGEFRVNVETAGAQVRPSIAADPWGNFVVVWQDFLGNNAWDIIGRAYRADGTALSGEFVVNSTTSNYQEFPQVAMSAAGTFIVTWRSFNQLDDLTYDIFGQLFEFPVVDPCVPGPTTLCLRDGRFRVQLSSSVAPTAPVTTLTDAAGYFTFGNPDNPEVFVKILDACTVNDRFWIFAAGLTDVGLSFTVTDSLTGTKRSYSNPAGRAFVPLLDTGALDVCRPPRGGPTAAIEARGLDQDVLSLRGGRFEARLLWAPGGEPNAAARSSAVSDAAGFFTFFNPDNPEVFVKVLDGCAVNGRFWVFTAGLTNTATRLEVRDLATGTSRIYSRPAGTAYLPFQDTAAFGTCP